MLSLFLGGAWKRGQEQLLSASFGGDGPPVSSTPLDLAIYNRRIKYSKFTN